MPVADLKNDSITVRFDWARCSENISVYIIDPDTDQPKPPMKRMTRGMARIRWNLMLASGYRKA